MLEKPPYVPTVATASIVTEEDAAADTVLKFTTTTEDPATALLTLAITGNATDLGWFYQQDGETELLSAPASHALTQ